MRPSTHTLPCRTLAGAWLLATLCLLAWLAITAPAASASRIAKPNALSYNVRLVGDATTQNRHLQALVQGAESVRHPVWWGDVEPSRGSFRWTAYDGLVDRLARNGLRLQVVLGLSAPWAAAYSGQSGSPPANPNDFANYARAVAARYGPGGSFWHANPSLPYLPVAEYEVWNEPNAAAYWYPSPDPAAYARLYLASRGAIRSVDSSARVITGGLGWDNAPSFVAGMYSVPGMKGGVDGVAYHPYALTVESSYALTRAVRSAVDAADSTSVPLDLTEFGWPTSASGNTPPGSSSQAWVDESTRASYMERMTSEYVRSDCNIGIVSAYSSLGPEANASDAEDWFGLHYRDGTPKQSGLAYTRALRQLAGRESGPTGRVSLCYPVATPASAPRRPKPKQRFGDWRKQACKIIKTRSQRKSVKRFHKKYCRRSKKKKAKPSSKLPPPPDWRKKTCKKLLTTKSRRRAFRRFHKKHCRTRAKRRPAKRS